MNAPCYNCERRHVGCHNNCPQYAAYKQKIADIKSISEKENQKEKSLLDYEQKRYHKTMKKIWR